MLYAHTCKKTLNRVYCFGSFLLMAILLVSCTTGGKRPPLKATYLPDTASLKLLKIDPAKTEEDPLGSAILDSVVYLPLETTGESMFSNINQLEVTKSYYIIADETTNSILLFTKNGRFYSKISNRGHKVEDSYKKIDKFAVNESKLQVIFADQHTDYIFYYAFDGKFLKKVKKDFNSEGYYALSENHTCFYRSTDQMLYRSAAQYFARNKEAERSRIVVANQKEIKKWYLPIDTIGLGPDDLYGVSQYFYNRHAGKVTLTLPYDYNVYEIDSAGQLFNSYRFVLPMKDVLPADFLISDEYKGKRIRYLEKHKPFVYAIADFYKVGNYITFRPINGLDLHNYLLYNLSSKKLFSIGTIVSDSLSFKLPLTEGRIYGVEPDQALVSLVASSSLFKAKLYLSGNEQWDKSLPPVLKKFFSGTNFQNPVLTLLYVKKESQ
ncbi:6-bladed beta-propeller [Pedobacter caeni]|uniref:6-bladed beta-propeller protein n=1 Tax=Pedobacter caeni TaxID=288992 RepID=A0A1M5C0V5_9SPHI|nr:6-bladed beta-propeller [Pedobacter caeni]SHF48331.1 hypothetical protein SAMN04488522_1021444 [Pedobacter caeni]